MCAEVKYVPFLTICDSVWIYRRHDAHSKCRAQPLEPQRFVNDSAPATSGVETWLRSVMVRVLVNVGDGEWDTMAQDQGRLGERQ